MSLLLIFPILAIGLVSSKTNIETINGIYRLDTNIVSNNDKEQIKISSELNIIEHSMTIMKSKIGKTEKEVDDIKSVVSNIVFDLPDIQKVFNKTINVENEIEDMKIDISSIETFHEIMNATIKSLNSRNKAIETSIIANKNAITNATVSNEMCTINTIKMATKIDLIDTNIKSLTLGMTDINNFVEINGHEYHSFKNETKKINNILRGLENQFNSFQAFTTSIEANMKTVQGTVKLVHTNISTIQGILSSDTNKLEQIQAAVNSIKNALGLNSPGSQLCDPPFVMVPGLGCLLFDKQYRTWDAALGFCHGRHGKHLLMLDTKEKRMAFIKYVKNQEYAHRWWLGGNNRAGSWRWTNDNIITEGWQPELGIHHGQPNEDDGNNTCLYWWMSYNGFWDSDCQNEYRTVCQKY